MVLLEKPTDGGLTDPTIGVRYTGFQPLQNWRLSLEGAAKIPVAGRRLLLSTGRTDYGVQASLQRPGDNMRSTSISRPSTTPAPAHLRRRIRKSFRRWCWATNTS